MKLAQNFSKHAMGAACLLLLSLTSACGGGGDKDPAPVGNTAPVAVTPEVPGAPGASDGGVNDPAADTTAPTVTSTQPSSNATGVARNATVVATFSEEMNAASLTGASMSVVGPDGVAIAGTVSYVAGALSARFTPATLVLMPADSIMTASIGSAAMDLAGNALGTTFVWQFKTSSSLDSTRPTVTLTAPANGAQNVARNSRIAATFSEDMNPASITAAGFKLTAADGTPVAGNVSYSPSSRTALFAPSMPATLAANTTFIGTIAGATDLAGNATATNHVWSFTTAASVDTLAPSVSSTSPTAATTSACSNRQVNATFSEPIDASTLTAASFTVRLSGPPLSAPIAGVVTYNTATSVGSFVATQALGAGDFTLTVSTAVRDLAGNPMSADHVTRFASSSAVCPVAPDLGAAAPFGAFGGNATLTNDGLQTVIRGDIGVNAPSSSITGLRDSGANVYSVTPGNDGLVDGLVYTLTAPPGSVAGAAVTLARSDALRAFDSISPTVLPGGVDVSDIAQCASCGGIGGGADELAGRTLPPGIYRSATGTYDIAGASRTVGNLTLDAGGDAGAVWIFQTAAGTGTLNVGLTGPATPAVPVQVLLVNGAQAKNVFWYVPAGATIGTGATMSGTMLSDGAITMSTTGGSPPNAVVTRLNGRALALSAGVTMTNTVIDTPAP